MVRWQPRSSFPKQQLVRTSVSPLVALPKMMMWPVTSGQCNISSQCLRYTDCNLNMTCKFCLWPSIYTKSFNFPKTVLSSAPELPVYPKYHNWTQNKISESIYFNSLHSRNIPNTFEWEVHWSFNHRDNGAFTQSLFFSNLLTPFVSIFASQFIKLQAPPDTFSASLSFEEVQIKLHGTDHHSIQDQTLTPTSWYW